MNQKAMIRNFASAAIFLCSLSTAAAQWQVPTNSIPYGRGQGIVGFGSIPNTGSGTMCLTDTIPPSFQTCGGGGGSGTVTEVISGTGLTGGPITGAGTLSVLYGTTAGTAAQGNDARITGALQATNNLSDIAVAGTARTNLGLGTMATQAASAVSITGGTLNGTLGATTPASVAATTITASTSIALTNNTAGTALSSITNTNAAGFIRNRMVGPTLTTDIFQNADSSAGIQTNTPGLFLDAKNASGVVTVRTGATPSDRITVGATGVVTIANLAGTSGCVVNDSNGVLSSTTCASGSTFTPGTNITTALQTALNNSDDITIPCGTFTITSALTFARAGQQLRGCGREKTVLQLGSALSGWFFTVTSLVGTGMYDLTIDLNNVSSNGGCILATGPSYLTKWHNVGCIKMSNGGVADTAQSNGFYWNSSDNTAPNAPRWSELKNCYLEDMTANGASFNAHSIGMNFADYVTISGCTSKDIDNGVNTQGSKYVTITGNVFEGNGAATTGFAGIRCSNNSFGITATGNVVKDMPRGVIIHECDVSTFTGNSIINTQYQSVLIVADALGNALYGTFGNNAMTTTCLSNTCSYAIEFTESGGGTNQGYTISGNTYLKSTSPVSAGMITVGAGAAAVCTGNSSDIGGETC